MLKMTYKGDVPVESNTAPDVWVAATDGTVAEVDDANVEGLAAVGWTAPKNQITAAINRAAGEATEQDELEREHIAASEAAPAADREDDNA